VSEITGVVGGK